MRRRGCAADAADRAAARRDRPRVAADFAGCAADGARSAGLEVAIGAAVRRPRRRRAAADSTTEYDGRAQHGGRAAARRRAPASRCPTAEPWMSRAGAPARRTA
ncbi:MAG: hypothetical protein MZW92_77665 [Comamonadaceae bacterium]|nr:hypothetical protein [Comamonadaceae bacterium]